MGVGMLSDERAIYIRENTKCFGLGMLHDFCTMSNALNSHDIKLSEVKEYLDYNKRCIESRLNSSASGEQPSNMRKGFVRKPKRECPNCGGIMRLYSVRKHDPAFKKYKSKWECCPNCQGGGCGYTEYLPEEIEEIINGGKSNEPT